MLVIKNAKIVNGDGIAPVAQDILIEEGKITKIAATIDAGNGKVIDAAGKYVLPGLIDLHAHFREPGQEYKETIETGSRAAAKGGFTTVFCMPNTRPTIDNAVVVESVLKEGQRVGLINVIPIGAITKEQSDQELTDMMELRRAGCRLLSDDGKSVNNAQLLRMALQYAKMTGLVLVEHCEDPLLSHGGLMNEGYYSTLLGMKGDPGISETTIVARDIEIARYLDARIHFAHMSLARSVDLIRRAKQDGLQVTAEVCPHHFTLTDQSLESFDTNFKVNPPLRTEEDVRALKEALKDGVIDCIATDHAPHAADEKERDFDKAPCGMIGLETALGLAVTELVEQGYLDWPKLVEKMSFNPAKISGLETKGVIQEGKDADIIIVDPVAQWEVKKEEIVSKSKNSPFIGRTLKGRVETTICNGKVVW